MSTWNLKEEISCYARIFAKNVKIYRKCKHLTQDQLSEITDIDKRVIQRIESGKNKTLKIENCIKIAHALDTNLLALFLNSEYDIEDIVLPYLKKISIVNADDFVKKFSPKNE